MTTTNIPQITPHRKDNQVKIIFSLVVVTVGMVTLISFLISYRALSDVAAASGKNWIEALAWPLIVDGPILAFSLAALLAMYLGKSPLGPRLLVGLATLATVFFNWANAPADPLSQLVSITAPLMYLLSFEILLWLVKAMVERQTLVASIDELSRDLSSGQDKLTRLSGQIERHETRLDVLKGQIKAAKSVSVQEMQQARQDKIEQRRQQVSQLLGQGETEQGIADAVGVSIKTIQRDIQTLSVPTNGKAVTQ